MTVSRPIQIIAVLSALLFAGSLAMRNATGSSDGDAAPTEPAPAAIQGDPALGGATGAGPVGDEPLVREPQAGSAEPAASAKPGTSAKPGASTKPKRTAAGDRTAARVRRAIAGDQVVVLLFTQPSGADDAAVREAVAAAGRVKGVVTFSDTTRNVAAYDDIIGGLGVERAPTVVLIGKDDRAELMEGYVDPESLQQRARDLKAADSR